MKSRRPEEKLLVSAFTRGADMHEVTSQEGGPMAPIIGGKPDKATQNIPLLELIARLNFRKKKPDKPPQDPTSSA